MPYPSVATFVFAGSGPGDAFEAAVELATGTDAHLRAIAPGVDRTDPGIYLGGTSTVLLRESSDRARDDASRLRQAIGDRLAGKTLRWELVDHVLQAPALPGFVAEQTRFCDLFVQDAPRDRDNMRSTSAVLEAALFDAAVPTLVVPKDTMPQPDPARVLIAWNDSDEALKAVRAALPFLRQAAETEIVIVDPPRNSPDRPDPGGALAGFLSRHGVPVEVTVLARNEADITDILIRRARDIDAGLIVMGAYGRMRMREAVAGGSTRQMLQRSPLPVLMAH